MALSRSRFERFRQTLNKRQTHLNLLLDNVHKPHNIAAILRTCDAVGIGEIDAVFPKPLLKECRHTAAGSSRWVDVNILEDLETGYQRARARKQQVLAAHFSDKAIDFREIDYTLPTCIVLGAEKNGVSNTTIEQADAHIIIPMLGMVQSLNVSVANALILYEAQRQCSEKGLYDEQRLDQNTVNQKLFEWYHPQIKKFCDKHQIRYPKLNDAGDIDDEKWHQIRQSLSE
ncbi:MAG: tRNA (guanosine(18)-2'-O)-methyltransferase TrmH [Pseudomonadota bacterium]